MLVTDRGGVVWSGGVGFANAEWEVPNTPDTRFRVGSVTKQFTVAVILQLVEEGLVDLQASLTTYLPDYPAATGDRITVHHLILTHTSGLHNYTDLPTLQTFLREPHTPAELMALVQDLPLDFEPRTSWAYSNSGYVALGMIIETVTGAPYADVLQERLLDPLGLTGSTYDDGVTVYPHAASGYSRGSQGLRRTDYLDTSVPYAAGMLLSTAEDLHAGSDALFGGRVFESQETLALMNTPHAPIPGGRRMAATATASSWARWTGTAAPSPSSSTAAASTGSRTGFWRLTDRDAVIAVSSNTQDAADEMGQGIVALLYGEDVEPPKPSALGTFREASAAGGVARSRPPSNRRAPATTWRSPSGTSTPSATRCSPMGTPRRPSRSSASTSPCTRTPGTRTTSWARGCSPPATRPAPSPAGSWRTTSTRRPARPGPSSPRSGSTSTPGPSRRRSSPATSATTRSSPASSSR